jgi:hypothetical protein
MVERKIYNKGKLVIARVSGRVKGQELVDYVFWLVDSHNIGEITSGYDQVVYVEDLESLNIEEDDIRRITEISTELGQGRGKFRTAIIAVSPNEIELGNLYRSLVKDVGREVELCSNFEQAFSWLGCENPEPEKYQ